MVCMAQLLGFHPRVIYNSSPLRNSPHSFPPTAAFFHAMAPKRCYSDGKGEIWVRSGWPGEMEAGSWKLLGSVSRQRWLRLAELLQRKQSKILTSLDWSACNGLLVTLLGIVSETGAKVNRSWPVKHFLKIMFYIE